MLIRNNKIYVVKVLGKHHFISEMEDYVVERKTNWVKILKFDLWHGKGYKWLKEIYVKTRVFKTLSESSKFIIDNNYTCIHRYRDDKNGVKTEYLEIPYCKYNEIVMKALRGQKDE